MNVSFNGLEDEIQALMVEWEELDDGEELLEAEPVAGGVEDPGVEVGALHAGVQPQCLPGQLPRGQGTGIGQRAEGLTLKYARNVIVSPCISMTYLDITFLLPLCKVTQKIQISGLGHPLNHLKQGICYCHVRLVSKWIFKINKNFPLELLSPALACLWPGQAARMSCVVLACSLGASERGMVIN